MRWHTGTRAAPRGSAARNPSYRYPAPRNRLTAQAAPRPLDIAGGPQGAEKLPRRPFRRSAHAAPLPPARPPRTQENPAPAAAARLHAADPRTSPPAQSPTSPAPSPRSGAQTAETAPPPAPPTLA